MAGTFGSWLAIAYLIGHLGMLLAARERNPEFRFVFRVDLLLISWFVAVLVFFSGTQFANSRGLQFLVLWSPLVLFWWGYIWAGKTLHTFHAPDFCRDSILLRLERRLLDSISLRWPQRAPKALTELFHFFYASYYAYTPILVVYLYANNRLLEFEAVAMAVNLGYAVSYTIFPLVPVWGPRWGLILEGKLKASEQKLSGYWLTRAINSIMYDGVAHKGGAFPSAHAATAVVFLLWSWRLWGSAGGVPAGVLVIGMCVASLYGRYHYLSDIACGVLLGLGSTWLADKLVLH